MISLFAIVTAQEKETIIKIDTIVPVQNTCLAAPASHWSFGFKTGVSKYLMPPVSPTEYDRLNLMIGGMVDYTFNPFIGIGLEYDFNDYSRPYTYRDYAGSFKGGTNDLILYGSVNLTNALVPFRAGFWKNMSIYGDVGGGIGLYHYYKYYNLINGSISDNGPISKEETMMVKLGVNIEFELSKSLNLCFAGQYNQYNTQFLTGSTSHKNCDAHIWTLALRYKIGSIRSKHARNISPCEYMPEPSPIIINETYLKGDTEELQNRLKAAEKENKASKQKLKKMKEEAEKVFLQ